MKTITKALTSFCNQEEMSIKKVGSNLYRIGFQGKQSRFDSLITINDDDNSLIIHTLLPLNAEPSHYTQIADLICHINAHLSFSAFEVSKKSGVIACRSGIQVGESDICNDTIKHTIFHNWMDTDVFFSAFAKVLFSHCDPEQAVVLAIDNYRSEAKSDQPHVNLSIRRNSLN